MEREACVYDHGFERSDLCAEIIIIIIIIEQTAFNVKTTTNYVLQWFCFVSSGFSPILYCWPNGIAIGKPVLMP